MIEIFLLSRIAKLLLSRIADFGPSGVRALPLAAGRNEAGHYFHYKNITALFHEYNRALPPYNCALPAI